MRLISLQGSLAKRLLPAMLLLAALVGEPIAVNSQQTSTDSSPSSPAQLSASDSASQVTPEEVGDALFIHHRYEKAIEAYKKAPKDSSEVWNKMGIAYEMMLDLKDAERCFKKSLRLNPRDDRVWNNLGSVYDAIQDHSRAERQYRQALKINPNSAVALRNLGTNLIFQGEFDQGQELYKRALALDCTIFDRSSDVPATTSTASVHQLGAMNYFKAKLYAQAGLLNRAIQYLRKSLNEGFTTAEKIAEDSSFAPLRGEPTFQHLLATRQEP